MVEGRLTVGRKAGAAVRAFTSVVRGPRLAAPPTAPTFTPSGTTTDPRLGGFAPRLTVTERTTGITTAGRKGVTRPTPTTAFPEAAAAGARIQETERLKESIEEKTKELKPKLVVVEKNVKLIDNINKQIEQNNKRLASIGITVSEEGVTRDIGATKSKEIDAKVSETQELFERAKKIRSETASFVKKEKLQTEVDLVNKDIRNLQIVETIHGRTPKKIKTLDISGQLPRVRAQFIPDVKVSIEPEEAGFRRLPSGALSRAEIEAEARKTLATSFGISLAAITAGQSLSVGGLAGLAKLGATTFGAGLIAETGVEAPQLDPFFQAPVVKERRVTQKIPQFDVPVVITQEQLKPVEIPFQIGAKRFKVKERGIILPEFETVTRPPTPQEVQLRKAAAKVAVFLVSEKALSKGLTFAEKAIVPKLQEKLTVAWFEPQEADFIKIGEETIAELRGIRRQIAGKEIRISPTKSIIETKGIRGKLGRFLKLETAKPSTQLVKLKTVAEFRTPEEIIKDFSVRFEDISKAGRLETRILTAEPLPIQRIIGGRGLAEIKPISLETLPVSFRTKPISFKTTPISLETRPLSLETFRPTILRPVPKGLIQVPTARAPVFPSEAERIGTFLKGRQFVGTIKVDGQEFIVRQIGITRPQTLDITAIEREIGKQKFKFFESQLGAKIGGELEPVAGGKIIPFKGEAIQKLTFKEAPFELNLSSFTKPKPITIKPISLKTKPISLESQLVSFKTKPISLKTEPISFKLKPVPSRELTFTTAPITEVKGFGFGAIEARFEVGGRPQLLEIPSLKLIEKTLTKQAVRLPLEKPTPLAKTFGEEVSKFRPLPQNLRIAATTSLGSASTTVTKEVTKTINLLRNFEKLAEVVTPLPPITTTIAQVPAPPLLIPGSAVFFGARAGTKELQKIQIKQLSDTGTIFETISIPREVQKITPIQVQIPLLDQRQQVVQRQQLKDLQKLSLGLGTIQALTPVSLTAQTPILLERQQISQRQQVVERQQLAERQQLQSLQRFATGTALAQRQQLAERTTPELKLTQFTFDFKVPPPPPPPPPFLLPFFKKKVKKPVLPFGRKTGYDTFLKVRGQFAKQNKLPLFKPTALALGAFLADQTSARTFKIKATKKRATGKVKRSGLLRKKFRKPIRKGVEIPAPNLFIERTPFLIDKPGEKREITEAGLRALRQGFFKPRKRKKKKRRRR